MKIYRMNHNIWAFNKFYVKNKPTILLKSHHDTIKPNEDYSRNPYFPQVEDDKLYGLGSNDAGGWLVALLASAAPSIPKNMKTTEKIHARLTFKGLVIIGLAWLMAGALVYIVYLKIQLLLH